MMMLLVASVVPGRVAGSDSVLIRMVANTPQPLQKLLHFCLYGVLTLLLVWALDVVTPESLRLAIAFTVAVGFGAAMAWYQTRVPGRFGTFADVALDGSGAMLGLLAATLLL